jgi:pyrophosphate--fructose-6-phosphate 1-phosphotransferase
MLIDTLTKEEKNNSLFEQAIRKLPTAACSIFLKGKRIVPVSFAEEGEVLATRDSVKIAKSFPKTVAQSNNCVLFASAQNANPPTGKRVAVLFSGGPAAGGHNVVTGIKRVLGADNTLLGVVAGPKGLIKGELFEISDEQTDRIFNSGGFDFLGSDRTKIKTDDQFEAVKKTCRDNGLNAIIVIGGDDSNTNAAILAEYLYDEGVQVIGVPKTIDGDLQAGNLLPITFGFDTATRVYSEMAGNILQDTPSSRKYWHFMKVMGRSASHVALEVALQTKPAVCLISEEVEEMKTSLSQIVELIAQTVIKRAKKGINHGCVIIPEGLIEFIPEFKSLIADLNDVLANFDEQMADMAMNEKRDFIAQKLTPERAQLFASLPDYIEEMLLLDRDSHGNLQVSQIPTERLLIDMVSRRVRELDRNVQFQTQNHFFGYEGRCGAPSRFDATYTYNLGLTAGSLVLAGKTGYIAAFNSFLEGGKPLAIPLTGLLNIERRGSEDLFSSPGPRQLWGPTSNQLPISVALNQGYENLMFTI